MKRYEGLIRDRERTDTYRTLYSSVTISECGCDSDVKLSPRPNLSSSPCSALLQNSGAQSSSASSSSPLVFDAVSPFPTRSVSNLAAASRPSRDVRRTSEQIVHDDCSGLPRN